jgi:hypothetical protein
MESIEHEYDHFGPWLLPIKSEADIPHQYFEHLDMINAAKYCFKIPVKEERRKLRPGMLLYNKLIVIEDERIVELSVVDHQISTHVISFKDVLYITHRGDLLNCEISLTTTNDCMPIRYNLVSMDFASAVMRLLRDSINSAPELVANVAPPTQPHSELQIFTYFCITENEVNKPKILNYQPSLDLGFLKSNKLFQSLNKYCLLDSIYMTNGVEFIIASRGQDIIQEHDTNYKFGHTFIPLKNIQEIFHEDDDTFNELQRVTIELGYQQVQFSVAKTFLIDSLSTIVKTEKSEFA